MDKGRELSGGNVAGQVVREGETVRKPGTPATASVHAFLEHPRRNGFHAAPRSHGRDANGRHVLEYIPGETIRTPQSLSCPDLFRIGTIIRDLHTAAQTFTPAPESVWNVATASDEQTLVCHNDLAPWNLVRDDDQWVFIDWDGSGPSSPIWDLAYAAQSFTALEEGGNPVHDAERLRAFAEGYGLSAEGCAVLPLRMVERTRAMQDLLVASAQSGVQPWARLHAEGHGDYWRRVTDYVTQNRDYWTASLTVRESFLS